jgi:hypothetical protein
MSSRHGFSYYNYYYYYYQSVLNFIVWVSISSCASNQLRMISYFHQSYALKTFTILRKEIRITMHHLHCHQAPSFPMKQMCHFCYFTMKLIAFLSEFGVFPKMQKHLISTVLTSLLPNCSQSMLKIFTFSSDRSRKINICTYFSCTPSCLLLYNNYTAWHGSMYLLSTTQFVDRSTTVSTDRYQNTLLLHWPTFGSSQQLGSSLIISHEEWVIATLSVTVNHQKCLPLQLYCRVAKLLPSNGYWVHCHGDR